MEDGLTPNLPPHTEKQLYSSHFFFLKKVVLTLARPQLVGFHRSRYTFVIYLFIDKNIDID
jgi:hypothetical protein